jgi:RNA polymerase sigma factor (sigma-70 family)
LSLVQRLKEKQETALSELMQLHGNYLLRTAVLLLKDQQRAEEAVQDTFITAYEKISQLADDDKVKSWMTAILINRCRLQMRKRSWKHAFLSFDLVERFQGDDIFQGPEQSLLMLAENQHLSQAIQELDYKYREAIILFYFNELKISEISGQLNLNENTVKARLSRGRSLLKQILLRGGDESGEGERRAKKTAR